MLLKNTHNGSAQLPVGVGLRHEHYDDVLSEPTEIDFVEVHAENFYADGGLALELLDEVRNIYDVSIHATSLGLGSFAPIDNKAIQAFKRLVDRVNPILVSDHACFTWTEDGSALQHSGDLLPIVFNRKGMEFFSENVDRVQQAIGRKILIENLSSYLELPGHTLTEFEFLQEVCVRAGSGILLDINNIFVNQVNLKTKNRGGVMMEIIDTLDADLVGEIHLAGCTVPLDGELMIDDHGQPVQGLVWQVFRKVVETFGAKPTLIEWDSNIPSWSVLVGEADKAKVVAENLEL